MSNQILGFFSVLHALTETTDQPDVEAPVAIGERWPVIRRGERAEISRLTRRLIRERDDNRCRFCGRRGGLLELDHIVPWSAGGADVSSNLRSLCHGCNTGRSNYRTEFDQLVVPVTHACDVCVATWELNYGDSLHSRRFPDAQKVTAYCGNCREVRFVTDPRRLR